MFKPNPLNYKFNRTIYYSTKTGLVDTPYSISLEKYIAFLEEKYNHQSKMEPAILEILGETSEDKDNA